MGQGSVISAGARATFVCIILDCYVRACVRACVCACVRVCVRACMTASQSIPPPPVLLPVMSFCHQLLNAESIDHSASRRQEYIPALSDRTARLGLSFIHMPTHRAAMCSHSSRTLHPSKM